MLKHKVRDPEGALAYMIDCTLATVEELALKKKPPIGELRRQCSIAQTGMDWAQQMNVDLESTRARYIDTTVKDYVVALRERSDLTVMDL